MKYIIILFSIITSPVFAQDIFLDDATLIRNMEGGYINLKTFDSIMSTNAYTLKVVANDDRTLKHLQIIPKTEADYKFEKEQEAFNTKFTMKCPDFTVILENGKKFNLNEHKNEITFFHFWVSDIMVSYKYLDKLNELYSKFKNNKRVNFLSINFDKNLSVLEKENFDSKIDFPLVFDENGTMDGFGFAVPGIPRDQLIPAYYIVNKKRDKVFVSAELRSLEIMEGIINNELKKPDVNE